MYSCYRIRQFKHPPQLHTLEPDCTLSFLSCLTKRKHWLTPYYTVLGDQPRITFPQIKKQNLLFLSYPATSINKM